MKCVLCVLYSYAFSTGDYLNVIERLKQVLKQAGKTVYIASIYTKLIVIMIDTINLIHLV